jgi:hypothetical protein
MRLGLGEETGHIVVTRDFGLFCQCLDQDISAAFYYKGKAFVLKTDDVIPLGVDIERTLPIMPKLRLVKAPKRSLWARIMLRFSIG